MEKIKLYIYIEKANNTDNRMINSKISSVEYVKIPKIIHPKKPDIWMDTWKNDYINKYKDYEYVSWDNENIRNVLDKYPKIKEMFNNEKEYCGKADMLRYLILYEYGGIYIDADSEWINDKDLTELINKIDKRGLTRIRLDNK